MPMETWQQLSALVVGFGSIGRRHTRILRELGLQDIRLCETMAERRHAATEEFGVTGTFETLEAALAGRPDTVFLCSPTALHIEQAMAAIESGADVFTEKPLAVSLDGIDELEQTARKLGRILMAGHCFRFHDGVLRAKKWLDEGRIGRLISVRSVVAEYIPEAMPNYRNMYISQYSGVYELMHDIDLAIWYAGRKPKRVFGIDGTFGDAEMKSPDLVEMVIEFEDRRVASVHLDFFERTRHRQTELFGTEGTIIVEFAQWDSCTVSIYEAATREWTRHEMKTDRDDMFRAEDRAFLVAVVSRSDPPVDVAAGRLPVEVMLAAQESSRTGRAVRFLG